MHRCFSASANSISNYQIETKTPLHLLTVNFPFIVILKVSSEGCFRVSASAVNLDSSQIFSLAAESELTHRPFPECPRQVTKIDVLHHNSLMSTDWIKLVLRLQKSSDEHIVGYSRTLMDIFVTKMFQAVYVTPTTF